MIPFEVLEESARNETVGCVRWAGTTLEEMDRDIQRLVDQTGVCLPLAARVMAIFAESGASRLEMSIALDLVKHLYHMLPAEYVPDGHPAAAAPISSEESPGS